MKCADRARAWTPAPVFGDTKGWANGLHIATIDYDGIRVGSVKLNTISE